MKIENLKEFKQLSWNPVLNKFKEIKNSFVQMFGEDSLYTYDENKETCLEYWIRMLDKENYAKLIEPLHLNEYNGALLLRYINDSSLFLIAREYAESGKDFWEVEDGFYSECRSVVIDIFNEELIITPFKKFRNLNECESTSLEIVEEKIKNANTVEFSNKLDGSMVCARWYKDNVWITSAQALDKNNSWRLKDASDMFYENPGYHLMCFLNPDKTFIFEYISMEDAHVVKYKPEEEGLYLIGIRNVETGKEYPYESVIKYADRFGIPSTKTFETSLDKVLNSLDKIKSSEAEGFVLNIDGFKVKIKYDDYVKVHRILSDISSPNLIIQCIADGQFDDLLAKVPDIYRDRVFKTADIVFEYVSKMTELCDFYFQKAPKENRKDFMVWTNENVPKFAVAYVKNMYLGNENNYVKSKNGHYKNKEEIIDLLFQVKEKLSEFCQNLNEKETEEKYLQLEEL